MSVLLSDIERGEYLNAADGWKRLYNEELHYFSDTPTKHCQYDQIKEYEMNEA
jgi:hypothetical protein